MLMSECANKCKAGGIIWGWLFTLINTWGLIVLTDMLNTQNYQLQQHTSEMWTSYSKPVNGVNLWLEPLWHACTRPPGVSLLCFIFRWRSGLPSSSCTLGMLKCFCHPLWSLFTYTKAPSAPAWSVHTFEHLTVTKATVAVILTPPPHPHVWLPPR